MRWQGLEQAAVVGAGGFLGSILRYGLGGLIHRVLPFSEFPYGTLGVNVVGCLAIGFLGAVGESRAWLGATGRLFLFLGVLGGFTTFSSFGYETHALLRDGEHLRAGANVVLQVLLGLIAVWGGHALARLG